MDSIDSRSPSVSLQGTQEQTKPSDAGALHTVLSRSSAASMSELTYKSDQPLVCAYKRSGSNVYSSSVDSNLSACKSASEAGSNPAAEMTPITRESLSHAGSVTLEEMGGPRHAPLANPGGVRAPCRSHAHSCGSDGALDVHFTPHTPGRCCSSPPSLRDFFLLRGPGYIAADQGKSDDLERGPPNIERIVLRINGLKCGCCGTSITRAVSRIRSVEKYQLNLVTARLELDLDTNRMPLAEFIQQINAKTGYTFEQHITSSGHVLVFIVSDFTMIQQAGVPYGISHLEAPEKDPWRPFQLLSGRSSTVPCNATPSKSNSTKVESNFVITASEGDEKSSNLGIATSCGRQQIARIYYDPSAIGARDILDYYQIFDPFLKLAPLSANTIAGTKPMRRALYMFLPTLALNIPVIVLAWNSVRSARLLHAHISLGLATVVQLIAWYEFVPNAARTLYHFHIFDMDGLIALSTSIAYAFSVVSYVFQLRGTPLETGSFFETSTLLVTLILLGRVINEFTRYRAAKSVSFRSLQVDEALLVNADPDAPINADPKTKKIDARLLQYGDHFKVLPHTRVVTDGVVIWGGSEIDESMITGESIPVAKGVQSAVYAGTNNGSGTLIVKLTALPHENSVHRIAEMVEDAELSKPKIQALADRIASWFVPVIAAIGMVVFLVWLFVERYHIKHSWKNAVVTAITYAIATLIVSCPCAIGLAVPMVILIASGVAARFGIIFRDPQKFEVARNVTDVVFDKTGTLTCGTLTVWEDLYFGKNPARVKGLLLSLLKDIDHPVSAGVRRHLERELRLHPEHNIKPLEVATIKSLPGYGITGTEVATGLEIRAGSAEWLSLAMPQQTSTLLCISIGSSLAATFKLTDRLRNTAELVVSSLVARGINVHMISGDNPGSVDAIAYATNIPKRHTKASCSPEAKRTYVQTLQHQGKTVLFIGDGTNDAIALKQADVGVHIPQSSQSTTCYPSSALSTTASSPPRPVTHDIAKSAADVVLMGPRLHDLVVLLDISRGAYRRILLNFSWSALYNVFAVLLAAGVFVAAGEKVRIEPRWAGLGELGSVLAGVGVAFSMKWGLGGGMGRVRGEEDEEN